MAGTYRWVGVGVGIVALGLWGYIHAYGWLDHWAALDKWLYLSRHSWLLREGWALPLLGVTGFVYGVLARKPAAPVFNTEAERFPQEERLLRNPYSVNLRTRYVFRGRERRGWVNLIEPFRGLLVLGSPGSGKSRYVVRPLIEQQLQKGFTMLVYDFKYDELTSHVYRCWKEHPCGATFHILDFDDLRRSQRCNPLHPDTLSDLAEAAEVSRVLLLGLNRDWVRRGQGDFFVESAINFLTAIIWFLRKYRDGLYCTLPHVIELMQTPYEQLFSILRTEPEIEFLVNPFISAYLENVMPQLEGQTAGAKISLARLSSPQLYYVLSGNDFSLDINNPSAPRIVCMGNNPRKQEVYGAVLSMYVSRLVRQVNRPGRLPCSLIFEEFPTLYFSGIDTLQATARANRVAVTLVAQDMSQLRKEYGREQAEVLLNITGNVISGQLSGDSAHQLSERFGRILQERRSVYPEERPGYAYHLDPALPPSRLATLSAGEMVGVVADNPGQVLRYKLFHGRLEAPGELPAAALPVLEEPPTDFDVINCYQRIKKEMQDLVAEATRRMMDDPGLQHLLVKRKNSK